MDFMIKLTSRTIDLAGMRFGKLTVVGPSHRERKSSGESRLLWACKCDCGAVTAVFGEYLRSGDTTSCGCVYRESIGNIRRTHGLSGTPTYNVWQHMHRRCRDQADKYYGGRGIKVCERWSTFEAFFSDMGEKPDGLSIERIDVNGHYTPENCRWATHPEQCSNRRSNFLLTMNGRTQHITAWAREIGIGAATLRERIARGWTIEEALTSPKTPPKSPRRARGHRA